MMRTSERFRTVPKGSLGFIFEFCLMKKIEQTVRIRSHSSAAVRMMGSDPGPLPTEASASWTCEAAVLEGKQGATCTVFEYRYVFWVRFSA